MPRRKPDIMSERKYELVLESTQLYNEWIGIVYGEDNRREPLTADQCLYLALLTWRDTVLARLERAKIEGKRVQHIIGQDDDIPFSPGQ